ncbi:hypothetical protein [Haloarchaeobius sp. DYHT-AS-18]|uniref:hypothetical protein n=1 Tax=Haloarchaeobius sp. DYHT-AS-18 TaxID=3446117 RepID=UPI003EBF19E1
MLEAIHLTIKTWRSGNGDEPEGLEAIDREDLIKRINEFEEIKNNCRSELDGLESRYRSTVDLPSAPAGLLRHEVRAELSSILTEAAMVRARFDEVMTVLLFLRQIELAKESDKSFDGLDIELGKLPKVTDDPEEMVPGSGFEAPASQPGPWAEPDDETTPLTSPIDCRIERVMSCIQNENPVPTLHALLKADLNTPPDEFDEYLEDNGDE